MKISKYMVALLAGIFFLAGANAQDVKLKCMEWNMKALEYRANDNVAKDISRFVAEIKSQQADIACFNEFETATGSMFNIEKLTEFAKELGMFPFFIYSYKHSSGSGYYGNCILSKYPIVNSSSARLGKYAGADQRSVGWVDILVPTAAKPAGVKVRIVCTHLDAFGGDATCLGQAKEVLEYAVAPAVAENIPVLLMGDMNCGPSSSAIREYEQTGKRLCNNDVTWDDRSKLDYFIGFPQNAWNCSDYSVLLGTYDLSDHYAISGTAVLNN
ncbi:MAG: endonuclease/exonuclease/phosphatase family protein [Alistipes sp.]|nr:endonuclease/exonuclease/phosphatase family protein [Alistipes sp.]